jgi:hypothetical protein
LSGENPEQWLHLHVDLRQLHAERCREVTNGSLSGQGEGLRSSDHSYLTKSLRESRRYRKLAEMYWALALSEEPENAQPLKMIVKTSPT